MAEPGEHDVLELIELVADALVDPRVGMPEHVHPPGTDRIEVAVAVEILEPDTFTTLDRNQRQLFVILHLRAGVPEHGEIALHPDLVQAHGVGLLHRDAAA